MSASAAGRVTVSGAFLAAALAVAGCITRAAPAFFIAPTESPHSDVVPIQRPPTVLPATARAPLSIPSISAASPTPQCTNSLSYVQDLTIPDGSNFAPLQPVDKKWQVQNNGTCNWDRRYGLKLISGDPMGTPSFLPLFPARAGTTAVLEIRFTAPAAGGLYECHWQAVDPQGRPFGDSVYMLISVAP